MGLYKTFHDPASSGSRPWSAVQATKRYYTTMWAAPFRKG